MELPAVTFETPPRSRLHSSSRLAAPSSAGIRQIHRYCPYASKFSKPTFRASPLSQSVFTAVNNMHGGEATGAAAAVSVAAGSGEDQCANLHVGALSTASTYQHAVDENGVQGTRRPVPSYLRSLLHDEAKKERDLRQLARLCQIRGGFEKGVMRRRAIDYSSYSIFKLQRLRHALIRAVGSYADGVVPRIYRVPDGWDLDRDDVLAREVIVFDSAIDYRSADTHESDFDCESLEDVDADVGDLVSAADWASDNYAAPCIELVKGNEMEDWNDEEEEWGDEEEESKVEEEECSDEEVKSNVENEEWGDEEDEGGEVEEGKDEQGAFDADNSNEQEPKANSTKYAESPHSSSKHPVVDCSMDSPSTEICLGNFSTPSVHYVVQPMEGSTGCDVTPNSVDNPDGVNFDALLNLNLISAALVKMGYHIPMLPDGKFDEGAVCTAFSHFLLQVRDEAISSGTLQSHF
ncbi:hypothetical protein HDU93_000164 [Gonapodya sp. JEL0774]|nr:hypothetical protein HDU93_000164 [Gonapodya sp. JEL0774]